MPCFNAMPYLPDALESIINQTYTNLEIICINDSSTDETPDVLEQFALRDTRIRVVHNETNLKLIATLNKGVQLAQGEFIARMDADDVSHPNRIKAEVNHLITHSEIDIISTGTYLINEKGSNVGKIVPRQFSPYSSLFASFFYTPIGHASLLGKTKVFKNAPYLDTPYTKHTEDYELWTRLLRKNIQFVNIAEILFYYRINPTGVSRKHLDLQILNFVKCAKIHYEEYFQEEVPFQIMKVVVNRIDKTLSFQELLSGISKIKKIKNHFFKGYQNDSKIVKKEMTTVYLTHVFDTSFQVVKRAKLKCKLIGCWFILNHIYLFFNISVLKYIFRKKKY